MQVRAGYNDSKKNADKKTIYNRSDEPDMGKTEDLPAVIFAQIFIQFR